MTSSEGFQQHFSIFLKLVSCGFHMKENVAFTVMSFAVLKWDDYLSVQMEPALSVQLPFEILVQIPVQLLQELEPNLPVQNGIELEFYLSRM